MKKIISSFVCLSVFFFSGCEAIDSVLQVKEDAMAQVQDIQNNIEEIQKNIEEKKQQLDEKLAQIDAAQKAISDVFETVQGNDQQEEINRLKSQALELQQKMQELQFEESAEKIELHDLGEFSIE